MHTRKCRQEASDRFAASPLGRAWLTVHEPRHITAAMIAIYMSFFACAVGMAFIADRSDPREQVVEMTSGVFMLIAGVLGTVGAWRGAHWLERPATVAGGVSVPLIALSLATGLDALSATDKSHVMLLMLALAGPAELVFYKRSKRLKCGAYAIGSGPLTPDQVAMAVDAMAEVEDPARAK